MLLPLLYIWSTCVCTTVFHQRDGKAINKASSSVLCKVKTFPWFQTILTILFCSQLKEWKYMQLIHFLLLFVMNRNMPITWVLNHLNTRIMGSDPLQVWMFFCVVAPPPNSRVLPNIYNWYAIIVLTQLHLVLSRTSSPPHIMFRWAQEQLHVHLIVLKFNVKHTKHNCSSSLLQFTTTTVVQPNLSHFHSDFYNHLIHQCRSYIFRFEFPVYWL
jgi:hypothetical protein